MGRDHFSDVVVWLLFVVSSLELACVFHLKHVVNSSKNEPFLSSFLVWSFFLKYVNVAMKMISGVTKKKRKSLIVVTVIAIKMVIVSLGSRRHSHLRPLFFLPFLQALYSRCTWGIILQVDHQAHLPYPHLPHGSGVRPKQGDDEVRDAVATRGDVGVFMDHRL